MNILIIDDERELCENLSTILKKEKYIVDTAYDGISGEKYAKKSIYDAIILDIILPQKNGLDVLKSLRASGIRTPIILLTVKSKVNDKVEGLNAGADDYLCKPFSSSELLARLCAITRRHGYLEDYTISFGETILNKKTYRLNRRDKSIRLTNKEYLTLELLMKNAGQIVSKTLIMEKIWGLDSDAEYNAQEVYISLLRKKLKAINSEMRIRSIRGAGYIFEEEK